MLAYEFKHMYIYPSLVTYWVKILHLVPGDTKKIIHSSSVFNFKNPEMTQLILTN